VEEEKLEESASELIKATKLSCKLMIFSMINWITIAIHLVI